MVQKWTKKCHNNSKKSQNGSFLPNYDQIMQFTPKLNQLFTTSNDFKGRVIHNNAYDLMS